MKATEVFERRRGEIEAQLRGAKDERETISRAMLAMERIAGEIAQGEQDEKVRQRQQAVLALARRSPAFLRAVRAEGELVVGEQPKADEKAGKMKLGAKAAGGVVLAGIALYAVMDGHMGLALLQAVGALLLVLGVSEKPQAPQMSARGVVRVDVPEMLRALGEICQAADICTDDLSLLESESAAAKLSGTVDDATLDLLSALMEAKQIGRGEAALRSLNQVEQYLRLMGMEIVPYAPEKAAWFDILPTMGDSRTVRPAIMKEGKLLRRGVAACRTERSGV